MNNKKGKVIHAEVAFPLQIYVNHHNLNDDIRVSVYG